MIVDFVYPRSGKPQAGKIFPEQGNSQPSNHAQKERKNNPDAVLTEHRRMNDK